MGTLRDDLRSRDAYPAGMAGPVDFVETHISWVFCTPADVFKVKRPVELGFLDFRTLEARARACEAEVTLNRRLAPGVYLDVRPVRRDAHGVHRIDGAEAGPGEVVDWAVHMVRLSDDVRADVRLARGTLDVADVDRIAARIAAFHRAARTDATIARFGAADSIRRNVVENFAQTRAWVTRYVSESDARAIERWQLDFLRDRAALFAARSASGHVRDGHGDLRLEHVYVKPHANDAAGEDVTIIDCIEFNDRFRYADTCADVAFLSMDLAWHGRTDLAERLLARYARDADDYGLYPLVDFYESYRAYVRAKIAGMLAADADVSPTSRARAESEARRYFLLALAARRPPLVDPRVVAVGGVIASGKSTVADAIGLELGAPVVDADRTRKSMLGVAPTDPVREGAFRGAYDPAFTDRVYAEVLSRARAVIASGRSVVLDASFRSPAMRQAARRLATSCGLPFHFVECDAPRDVCRARLVRRAASADVSDGRLEIFDDFCARWEPPHELAPAEHLRVDTSLPLATTVAAVRDAVNLWPQGLVA